MAIDGLLHGAECMKVALDHFGDGCVELARWDTLKELEETGREAPDVGTRLCRSCKKRFGWRCCAEQATEATAATRLALLLCQGLM
jgi:hypothetical protein